MSDEFDSKRRGEAGAVDASADRRDADERGNGKERYSEADILRDELAAARDEAARLNEELAEAKDRFLRSRAEFDTFRRRMTGEVDLAKDCLLYTSDAAD